MIRAAAPLLFAVALSGCVAEAPGAARFVSPVGPVGEYAVPVRSMMDQRFATIIRQRYDFSCGSAALATLLRFHYDFDVREEDAFRGMWAKGDQAQIRRLGFSLLDMKRWLASRGLSADGYKVSLDRVAETGVPGIALIAVKQYRHFVVVKGVRGNEVLIGDPSTGITVMPRRQFETVWNGIYFVLSADRDRARSSFNRTTQWIAYTRAPVGGPFADPVSQQALALTAPFQREF